MLCEATVMHWPHCNIDRFFFIINSDQLPTRKKKSDQAQNLIEMYEKKMAKFHSWQSPFQVSGVLRLAAVSV